MDRVFLDANVLFSAAYRLNSRLLRLWQLRQVQLVTSAYAMQEAMANLPDQDQRRRLESLLGTTEVVLESEEVPLPDEIVLPVTDQPILRAAIAAGATHLLTGDKAHFGRYFGQSVKGVMILPPSAYTRAS